MHRPVAASRTKGQYMPYSLWFKCLWWQITRDATHNGSIMRATVFMTSYSDLMAVSASLSMIGKNPPSRSVLMVLPELCHVSFLKPVAGMGRGNHELPVKTWSWVGQAAGRSLGSC